MPRDLRRVARTIRQGAKAAGDELRGRDVRSAGRFAMCGAVNSFQLLVGSTSNRRSCPCCGWQGVGFLWSTNERTLSRGAKCPKCGSSSRHRALAIVLPKYLADASASEILHFAPEPQLATVLRAATGDANYRTTDLFRSDVDLPGEDIQNLSLGDGSADLILCNHVLEHVIDDRSAISEIARVLREDGEAILTVPGFWNPGDLTVEFTSPDRNGHWRHYGTDFEKLLGASFQTIEHVPGASIADDPVRYGIRPEEPVFVCREPIRP
jgi:SAM-dependent methyltransferase